MHHTCAPVDPADNRERVGEGQRQGEMGVGGKKRGDGGRGRERVERGREG